MGVRLLLGTAVAIVLATAADARWEKSAKVDRITGETSVSFGVITMRTKVTGSSRTVGASASMNCIEGKPHILFHFGFPVGNDGNGFVAYRFDDLPGKKPAASFFNLSSPFISNPADVNAFLSDAAAAKKVLYLRVTSTLGAAEAEFDIRGGEKAVSEFRKSCPAS